MEKLGCHKFLMILSIALLVFLLAAAAEGGRDLKMEKEDDRGAADQPPNPPNYFGGFGTSGGLIPAPNGGVTVVLGPTGFCSFPGLGCVRVQPSVPGGVTVTGSGSPPP